VNAPYQRSAVAQGVRALIAQVRRRAKATIDQKRMDGLMEQVAKLRAAGECSAADFDKAGALYCASTLAIARQGVGA